MSKQLQTREEPVDPRRRIIDPHHHLWRQGEAVDGGGEQYLVADLLADIGAGHNVTDTVYMECGAGYRQEGPQALRPVGETEFATAQAEASEGGATRIAAVVAFADLTLGEAVEDVLASHEVAGRGRFRGVRHMVAADADIPLGPNRPRLGLLAEDSFRRGLRRLGANGYSFDAMLFHSQLPELAQAAQAIPETTFVLNHLGVPIRLGPYRDRQVVIPMWQRGMRQAAACPNVVVKLGGIGMDSLFGTTWSSREEPPGSDEVAERWGDDIRWCIDTFGPSRCMFESNFPVDRRALTYPVLWNAFQKMAASYSDDEQDALFATTAARVYRIQASEGGATPVAQEA